MDSKVKMQEKAHRIEWWFGILCTAIAEGGFLLPDFFISLEELENGNVCNPPDPKRGDSESNKNEGH